LCTTTNPNTPVANATLENAKHPCCATQPRHPTMPHRRMSNDRQRPRLTMFAMERCCSTHQIQLLKDNRSVHGSGAEHVRPAHLLADSGEHEPKRAGVVQRRTCTSQTSAVWLRSSVRPPVSRLTTRTKPALKEYASTRSLAATCSTRAFGISVFCQPDGHLREAAHPRPTVWVLAAELERRHWVHLSFGGSAAPQQVATLWSPAANRRANTNLRR
jgi:hypothetical protein